jgi:predicted N-acyltransferase
MIFSIPEHWNNEQDYINALSKKYRDQYKRARKKAEGIIKRKLALEEIEQNEALIYELYHHVMIEFINQCFILLYFFQS